MARPRIVVVGAGFGGLALVKGLAGVDADITVIDRTNHHLFQPLLYQAATAALSPSDIAVATRTLFRDRPEVDVLMGEVVALDTRGRTVRVSGMGDQPYDWLVLATGAGQQFFGHDDWADHVHVLKTTADAIALREDLLEAFETAETRSDPVEVARLTTFVIVGGGPTGVEMAGAVAELARSTLVRDYRHFDPRQARVVLIEAGPRLLASFAESLSAYAERALCALGVEVLTGQAVRGIDASGVTLDDLRIDARVVVWCAGVRAGPTVALLETPLARDGAAMVGADFAVPGLDRTFVIGDASALGSEGCGLPRLGAVARQQGSWLARRIRAEIDGRPAPPPFRYRDWGTMAIIGRSRAVATFGRFRMRGTIAWLAWSLVHLLLLVDFRSRVAVYMSWIWAWLTQGRAARLIASRSIR